MICNRCFDREFDKNRGLIFDFVARLGIQGSYYFLVTILNYENCGQLLKTFQTGFCGNTHTVTNEAINVSMRDRSC